MQRAPLPLHVLRIEGDQRATAALCGKARATSGKRMTSPSIRTITIPRNASSETSRVVAFSFAFRFCYRRFCYGTVNLRAFDHQGLL